MKNFYAKAGERINVEPAVNNDINNLKEYNESLTSTLIDMMIDALEEYINDGKTKYYTRGDANFTLKAFKEFVELVYKSKSGVGVRKSTSSLNTDCFRYYFDSNKEKLEYYLHLMYLKDKYENEDKKEDVKPITRTRIPNGMAPHKPYHSNR